MPTYFQRPENALKRANGNEIFFSVCPSFTSAGATCWTRNAWDIIPCSCKLCDDLAIGVFVVYVFEYESFCEDVMKIKPPKFRFFEMSPVRISQIVLYSLLTILRWPGYAQVSTGSVGQVIILSDSSWMKM